jgi:N6-adenosine-specific RNA methylase IME4
MFPGQNKIELFARETTEGWDCHGNEVESTITLEEITNA